MLDATATVMVELRETENARDFPVGPSLRIGSDSLRIADRGKPLMSLPEGQWVHFELRFPLTGQGSYQLRVQPVGAAEQVFDNLPYRSADFIRCGWVGFSGSGKQPACFYLDNLRLDRSEPDQ